MRRIAVLLSICAALPLLAQEPPPPGGGRRGPRGGMMRMSPAMRALDLDGDGVISSSEMKQAAASLAKLDKNGDGKLTGDELRPQGGMRPGGERGGPGGPGGGEREAAAATPEETVKMMMQFDRNGDGKLDKSEVPERMQGLFARGDANKDGILTRGELMQTATKQAARQPQDGPGRGGGMMRMDPIMLALDADHNGEISQKEWQAAPKVMLKLDKNNDGQLTADEVRPNFPGGGGRADH